MSLCETLQSTLLLTFHCFNVFTPILIRATTIIQSPTAYGASTRENSSWKTTKPSSCSGCSSNLAPASVAPVTAGKYKFPIFLYKWFRYLRWWRRGGPRVRMNNGCGVPCRGQCQESLRSQAPAPRDEITRTSLSTHRYNVLSCHFSHNAWVSVTEKGLLLLVTTW